MARLEKRHRTNPIRRIGDPRDVLVTKWELENETIQVLKPMYRAMHDYFKENGWTHPQSDDDVYEDLWWERWHGGMQDLKENWIWWRLKLDVNAYIRHLVIFDWQTLFVKPDQKLLYRGKKVQGKVERINLIMRASFYLQFDIDDKFKSSIAWKLRGTFFNRMYQQEIEQQKDDLNVFAHKLERLMKGLMALEKDEAWAANQYGPLGYGKWGDDEDMKVS